MKVDVREKDYFRYYDLCNNHLYWRICLCYQALRKCLQVIQPGSLEIWYHSVLFYIPGYLIPASTGILYSALSNLLGLTLSASNLSCHGLQIWNASAVAPQARIDFQEFQAIHDCFTLFLPAHFLGMPLPMKLISINPDRSANHGSEWCPSAHLSHYSTGPANRI